ncbi:2-C-methyl-D-erythritol 4-phosphate cytidylyltransferase [Clostridium cellulovorans]|uniref:2-C-methyl-D-erythritol 4-phosphate cytidylyltransferase n=1 Tax=Clostridium cellulovorans (strain ATCC 35296 / DSM 3052 / OCM 3 / 743B) TaxID=573061 RepID=D9SXC2_CLOC7|nr:2-C-methyl-D-erythritol 4-phosphate cytidylyltransferase [Clostridium cellulovorans]ADL53425.1 2-C-methyl-D-erythritol 4-phosphate cytidylyltransferase [Clostridium cellulovorans 743B]
MSKVSAVILAAGKGKRMGAAVNKQFLELKDKPIIYYAIKAFEDNSNVDEIVLVAAKEEVEYIKESVVKKYFFSKVKEVVIGGTERQDSVFAGLSALKNCEYVLIHDGARPFVTNEIIDNGIKYVKQYGATACGVTPKDTIKLKDENNISVDTLKRNELFCVQTPQTFKFDVIYRAHEIINQKSLEVTDDTMAAEILGEKVYLYEGTYENIKITTPEDIIIAENILNRFL